MVKRLKLSEKLLRCGDEQEGRSYQIFDTEIRGLAARIHSSGMRSFTLDYRFAGRQRRMTVGRWPEWSVTAVRERAKGWRERVLPLWKETACAIRAWIAIRPNPLSRSSK